MRACAFVYRHSCVCGWEKRGAGDCLLFDKLAASQPPAGLWVTTRGLSGKCEPFESSVAAPCCFCQKQAKLRFGAIAEARGLLLNSHSAQHLNAPHNAVFFFFKLAWCVLSSPHKWS